MNKSVHEVENILKVALAAKKEEMASIQKCNRPLIRLKKKFLSYKIAEKLDWLFYGQWGLELDKNMAKADEALRARELTITEEKNKKEEIK
jgi:inorganic pyrophosphatase